MSRAHILHPGLGAIRHEASGLEGKNLSPRARRPRDHLAVAARPCRFDPAYKTVIGLQVTTGEIEVGWRPPVRSSPLDRGLNFCGAPGVLSLALLGQVLVEVVRGEAPLASMFGQPLAGELHRLGGWHPRLALKHLEHAVAARLGGEVEDYRAGMDEDAAIGRQTPVTLALFLKGAETFLGDLNCKGVEPLLILGR